MKIGGFLDIELCLCVYGGVIIYIVKLMGIINLIERVGMFGI